jgi:hypothetical protein
MEVKMRGLRGVLPLVLLLSLGLPSVVAGQAETWDVGLSRDFGYAAGGDIQGRFTMRVDELDGLTQVAFLIDGEVVGTDREAPFEFQFSTGNYPLGAHTLAAVGTLEGGGEIRTPERTVEFVSADEGWKAALRIAGPVLGVVLAVTLIGMLGPLILDRGKKGFRRGVYGPAGGAVCSRCGLPFSRHMLSPNLLLGKLERCPHCGRWSIARQASRAELEVAEARLDADAQRGAIQVEGEGERLRRELDDSRYES